MCFNCESDSAVLERVILITGGASELGQAVVAAFAAASYPVLAIDRRLPRAAPEHCRILRHAVDPSLPGSMLMPIKAAETEFGPIDCVIHCVGWLDQTGEAKSGGEGMQAVIEALRAGMEARGRGTIIVITKAGDRDEAAADWLADAMLMVGRWRGARMVHLAVGVEAGRVDPAEIAKLVLTCYQLPNSISVENLVVTTTESDK